MRAGEKWLRKKRASRALSSAFATFVMLGVLALASCFSGQGPPLDLQIPDATPPPPVNLESDAGMVGVDVDLGDPFQLNGLVPSHGPFTGGTRTTLNGRGFPSDVAVLFGDTALDPSAVFASDPNHAAITTPPGTPGPIDVTVRNNTTLDVRTLEDGFIYDAFAITPTGGATAGGTRVSIVGSGTSWTAGTSIAFATTACGDVTVTDATHIQCTTAANPPGTVDVTITNPDASFDHAADAFTFSDSPDGYRGGLTGGALDGNLTVLALDSYTGDAIEGAFVIAGSLSATSNADGVATISDPSLTGNVTVTVAAKCHQPTSFVAVPVDTVTTFLSPTLDPSCGMGEPPSTGNGTGSQLGTITGELVWGTSADYARSGWMTVPPVQRATERQAAYVFIAPGSATSAWQLPDPAAAILPTTTGTYGYTYSISAVPGNVTLYALAGIEDRTTTPPQFTAYVMGVVQGVSVLPGGTTSLADLPMTSLLDHTVTLDATPPAPTTRGPDRILTQLAVTIGNGAYGILPVSAETHLLPLSGDLSFAGVPGLDHGLVNSSYALSGIAATGTMFNNPASVVQNVLTNNANTPVALGGFLQVPVFVEPSTGQWNGTHISFEASGAFDLSSITIESSGGLVEWSVIAPGNVTSFDLPDLNALPDSVGLIHGEIQTVIYVARIGGFDYGSLRYGQLQTDAWDAYAFDVATGSY